jgi:hypothetical protein
VLKAQLVIPAGRALKLCVYKDSCTGSSSCGNQSGPTTISVQYKVSGTCALTDDTTVKIMVQPQDSKGSCDSYKLSFRYDEC